MRKERMRRQNYWGCCCPVIFVVAQGYCHSRCYSRLLSDRKLNFMANMWRPPFHIIDGGKRHIFGPYSCKRRASYDAWRQELRFQFPCSPCYFLTIQNSHSDVVKFIWCKKYVIKPSKDFNFSALAPSWEIQGLCSGPAVLIALINITGPEYSPHPDVG